MGYITDLRQIEGVGHRPLQMAACGVFIFDEQNRILLEQRADDKTWCVPGGSMELGETPEEVARRECLEETGLILGALKIHNVISGENSHFTYPNGDEVYAVDINFICRSFYGTIKKQDEEVLQIQFFERGALPQNLSGNDKKIINEIWNVEKVEEDHSDVQEKIVREYFNAWLKKEGNLLEKLFDENVVYTECYGPEYHGIEQIKRWFWDWNQRGTVLEWTIKRCVHQNHITVAEWYFKCEYNGSIDGFDGCSIVEFNADKKIVNLKEYQSKAEHCFPYEQ